jgi:hypothetical protein
VVKSALRESSNLGLRLSELSDESWDALRQELMDTSAPHNLSTPQLGANAE